MIYDIEYSREHQRLLCLKSFAEANRGDALERELELSRQGLQLEIVLLVADSEATIRNTHPRYFGDPFGADMHNVLVHSQKLEPKVA